jgi:pimeloyl-ACP methyl ester carboxylesterase
MQTAFLIAILAVAVLALWTRFVAAKAASRHPPTGIFVPVTGGRLHLRDLGPRDAPPERTIVMLHGASCNLLALTLPLAGPLSKTFRVIAIDRPGHGHSDRPGGRADASIARQAELISEAMVAAGAPKAIILAHSFSGALGLTLALDHPDRVAGLVLIGPVSHPWPGGITWYYHVGSWPVIGWIFSHLLPVPGAALTMQSGVNGVFAPQKPPPNYVETTALPLLLRPVNFMANAEDVAGLHAHVTERSKHYHRITAPAVVISGEDDRTVYTSIHTAALSRELPDVTVHVLKSVGHVPHHARTDFVVDAIEALAARLATLPEKTAG